MDEEDFDFDGELNDDPQLLTTLSQGSLTDAAANLVLRHELDTVDSHIRPNAAQDRIYPKLVCGTSESLLLSCS